MSFQSDALLRSDNSNVVLTSGAWSPTRQGLLVTDTCIPAVKYITQLYSA